MQLQFTCQLEEVMGCTEIRDSMLIRIDSGEGNCQLQSLSHFEWWSTTLESTGGAPEGFKI